MKTRAHLWIAAALTAVGLLFAAAPFALAAHHEGGENPCAEEANPCGEEANPCGEEENPCGEEANPCGGSD